MFQRHKPGDVELFMILSSHEIAKMTPRRRENKENQDERKQETQVGFTFHRLYDVHHFIYLSVASDVAK